MPDHFTALTLLQALCCHGKALPLHTSFVFDTQIQAELGEGHVNVIEAKEVLVTHTHLALSLEYAAGGSLTSYVADRWQHSQHSGLFLSEDEARYFFRVRVTAALLAAHLYCMLLWSHSADCVTDDD